jgi:hypothetical protein
MAFAANRRLLCLITALLFAVSSVAHAYAATAAAMKLPSAAIAASGHDMDGMDCGSGKATHATCIAMCATTVAILNEPVIVPLVVAAHDMVAKPELPPLGRDCSPDPHPPKR